MLCLPNPVKNVLYRLNRAGFEAYIVGGCVRDHLLGQVPNDYDVTTSALPEEIKQVFASETVIETGLKHGTITVLVDEMSIEITTYRIDLSYSDHRHPDAVQFTSSLQEDLARRDFTINAIAYSDSSGLYDPWNGAEDIAHKIIRCVGQADKRFQEDSLRMMRALRFSSVLGFPLEQRTKDAIASNASLLTYASAERLSSELVKLLCGEKADSVLSQFNQVLGVVIPELLWMDSFLLDHIAKTVVYVPREPVLRLAAFLHHIGDGNTHALAGATEENTQNSSAQTADCILKRLKFDNKTRTAVVMLIQNQSMKIKTDAVSVKRAMNQLTPDGFFALLALRRADHLAATSCFQTSKDLNVLQTQAMDYEVLYQIGQNILAQGECYSLSSLSVSGTDLIQIGMKPGKEIGSSLRFLLDAVIDGKVPNEKDALLYFLQKAEIP